VSGRRLSKKYCQSPQAEPKNSKIWTLALESILVVCDEQLVDSICILKQINPDDDDEDDIILFGCKLIASAAVEIGSRHRHAGVRKGTTTIFRVRQSLHQSTEEWGIGTFDARIGCSTNHSGIFTTNWGTGLSHQDR
jgi:hypothetical protein